MPPCPLCLAIEHGSDDSLRALVIYQAAQLDRLTGGRYEQPTPEQLIADVEPEAPKPPADVVATIEKLLWADGIYRCPPRAAAPRLLEHLSEAGYLITQEGS